MSANIEWVVGTLRCGPEMKKFGDPYTFTATVIRRDTSVEIIGASGDMYPGLIDEIKAALHVLGVTEAWWERVKSTGIRRMRIPITGADK